MVKVDWGQREGRCVEGPPCWQRAHSGGSREGLACMPGLAWQPEVELQGGWAEQGGGQVEEGWLKNESQKFTSL